MQSRIFSLMQQLQRLDEALAIEQARPAPHTLRIFALRTAKKAGLARMQRLTRRLGSPQPA